MTSPQAITAPFLRRAQAFAIRSKRRRRLAQMAKYEAFVEPSMDKVRGLTMAGGASLNSMGIQTLQVIEEQIPGDLVECGVWRGGASLLMADLLRRKQVVDRKVWMFDSFEGLSPPKDLDGEKAAHYSADVESPTYFDNCAASLEEVKQSAAGLGLGDRVELVKGWFEETLPKEKMQIGPISLLRLDGDWYESTKVALEALYDQVSPGGFVILDDYYIWEGCAIAVHEFLGTRKLGHRIVAVTDRQGVSETAYFRKV